MRLVFLCMRRYEHKPVVEARKGVGTASGFSSCFNIENGPMSKTSGRMVGSQGGQAHRERQHLQVTSYHPQATCSRLIFASKNISKHVQNGAKTRIWRPFDVFMGNSLQPSAIVWSISRFYLPIKRPISRCSSRKTTTREANIPGARRTA
jgi:hypothetical protein